MSHRARYGLIFPTSFGQNDRYYFQIEIHVFLGHVANPVCLHVQRKVISSFPFPCPTPESRPSYREPPFLVLVSPFGDTGYQPGYVSVLLLFYSSRPMCMCTYRWVYINPFMLGFVGFKYMHTRDWHLDAAHKAASCGASIPFGFWLTPWLLYF